MQVYKSIYKKIIGSCLLSALAITICSAQVPRAVAGPKGIWIVCGDKLPKKFSYKISRQKPNSDWVPVATLTMPESKEQIKATMLNTGMLTGFITAPISEARLEALWQRVVPAAELSSPFEISDDLPLRAGTGTAWYDATADSATMYVYKVQRVDKEGNMTEDLLKNVKYPGKTFSAVIKPSLITPSATGVYGEFLVTDKGVMTHCKIFRSYYLHSGYREISAKPLFVTRNKTLFITFTDDTATDKVPYAYVVVPLDAANNVGDQSPELRAFNVTDKTIVPSVVNFTTTSVTSKKAIKLSWRLPKTQQLTSIDLYKCETFEGNYQKIASLSPADTTYMDYEVAPIKTYYYTAMLNGIYEKSPPSPRIPGILRASNANTYPPNNVHLVQTGQVVKLIFDRVENDTHGYFIYRAKGTAPLKQLGSPIISDQGRVVFIDTLPAAVTPTIYKYAVADENTSYVISPKSAQVMAYLGGLQTLPIPHNVYARLTNNGKIQVIWPDMRNESRAINGYRLYKRLGTDTAKGTPVSAGIIPINQNNYTDSAITEGSVYYSVRTVSDDGVTLSSPSLEAGITIQTEVINPVTNIKVFPAGNQVQLSWNNPLGQPFKAIKIYRAPEGKAQAEIASIGPNVESYTDKDVNAGSIYYYTFVVVDSAGKTSVMTQPAGVHL